MIRKTWITAVLAGLMGCCTMAAGQDAPAPPQPTPAPATPAQETPPPVDAPKEPPQGGGATEGGVQVEVPTPPDPPQNAQSLLENAVRVFRRSRNVEYQVRGQLPAVRELKPESVEGKVWVIPSPEANDATKMRIKADLKGRIEGEPDELTLFWNGDLLIMLSERQKLWAEVDFGGRDKTPPGGEWINRIVPRVMFRDPDDLKLPQMGEGLTYAGQKDVDGRPCHVFVSRDKTPERSTDPRPRDREDRWYVGVHDLILRQYELIESSSEDEKHPVQGLKLEITAIRTNLNLDEDAVFSLPPPPGAEPVRKSKDKEGKRKGGKGDKGEKPGKGEKGAGDDDPITDRGGDGGGEGETGDDGGRSAKGGDAGAAEGDEGAGGGEGAEGRNKKDKLEVGEVAQDWELKDPDGKPVKLSDLRGKVVMMDFWKSGCSACMDAVPFLNKFHEQYKDKDFMVLGVNVFESKDPIATIKEKKLNHPQALGGDPVAKLYGVKSTPTFIIVGKDGKVALRASGHYNGMEEDMARKIERILEGKDKDDKDKEGKEKRNEADPHAGHDHD